MTATASPAESPTVTVQGETVRLPVEVRSARLVAATFTAPATAAQELVDYSGLRVVRVAGTLALCSLGAVQYIDTDLGPYHEFALAVVVEPHDGSPGSALTTLIHRLPVNQPFTCAAGREIWGFPKWETDITYLPRGRRTDVVVSEGDRILVGMAVRRGGIPAPSPPLQMTSYSWRSGVLRRTPWEMRLSQVTVRPGGATVEVGENHEMSDDLRRLRFPKPALVSANVGHLEATFGEPETVSMRGD